MHCFGLPSEGIHFQKVSLKPSVAIRYYLTNNKRTLEIISWISDCSESLRDWLIKVLFLAGQGLLSLLTCQIRLYGLLSF
jgi:hypothetical protein